ncbi:CsbD family protein [Secundilactobacillus oryzae]|uniref:CsbD family protein n=1 Tax=Secundilactobacillus oryzae TaxID=1202668 RepID=UPI0006D159A3|nr:CsbD family protein [Secundilactobacillus oryzae]
MAKELDAKKDKLVGSVKEQAGKATGDQSTELKGKLQKEKGKMKEKTEEMKDKASEKNERHA